jgi:hypothetical protein
MEKSTAIAIHELTQKGYYVFVYISITVAGAGVFKVNYY